MMHSKNEKHLTEVYYTLPLNNKPPLYTHVCGVLTSPSSSFSSQSEAVMDI